MRDPREVVKPGDVVMVKVLDVDIPRKRIFLTLRLDDEVTLGWPKVSAADRVRTGSASPGEASPGEASPGGQARGGQARGSQGSAGQATARASRAARQRGDG